jgi:hypothetical protein
VPRFCKEIYFIDQDGKDNDEADDCGPLHSFALWAFIDRFHIQLFLADYRCLDFARHDKFNADMAGREAHMIGVMLYMAGREARHGGS